MTTSSDLRIEVDSGHQEATVSVQGEIDYGSVSHLRSVLADLSETQSDLPVVLDLSQVTFIDSTGLGVLVQAKQRIEAAGRSMKVRDPQPRVQRVLELGGLLDYLT